ncbi:MAG: DMT family transporter [Betaproteobacteria bacterium]|uniref:DMT family transporter n=1 Tax=Ferrovum sp. PN-J185 TaxID=1356306 RepID=UPI000797E681|nr:DMT family transporter [Ferrovum sp. PN-J185]KXW55185.1 O-acetylserine/cysteine export protein [Ferrovum sp. PN-J185]MDE1892449.1 DMT family transporter [Betaproteobacteria bacterium]MDE2056806.1 DMT family transporter [Betaproteobacteria bacterium]
MKKYSVIWYTTFAMVAFAANSLLCRLALKNTQIDPTIFTDVRLLSGVVTLGLINLSKKQLSIASGNWTSAISLFIYALFFSLAYVSLPAGIGAILLFGSVQLSMISFGIFKGERFTFLQTSGFILAVVGLGILFLPGLTTPPLKGSILMVVSGFAWALYSINGKKSRSPLQDTFGNFLRSLPLLLLFTIFTLHGQRFDMLGIVYACLSGAVASGLGYSIWYSVLPQLKSTYAATVQLSVPVIASFAAIFILNESLTIRLFFSSLAILLGIAIVIMTKKQS